MQPGANNRAIYQSQRRRQMQSWRRRCSRGVWDWYEISQTCRRAGVRRKKDLPRAAYVCQGRDGMQSVCISRQGFQGPGGC
jgi:hypothetical protein